MRYFVLREVLLLLLVSVPGGPLVSKEGGHLLSMQETGIL